MTEKDEPDTRYRYRTSLRVWHPSLDPREITEALGIEPQRSWQAGMPRSTPVGTPLSGLNRETYWSARCTEGAWPPTSLPDAVDQALARLARHKVFFCRVRAEGGRAEFFVGWFFSGKNTGDVFTHDLLAKLADLQIDLSLDLYSPDDQR